MILSQKLLVLSVWSRERIRSAGRKLIETSKISNERARFVLEKLDLFLDGVVKTFDAKLMKITCIDAKAKKAKLIVKGNIPSGSHISTVFK